MHSFLTPLPEYAGTKAVLLIYHIVKQIGSYGIISFGVAQSCSHTGAYIKKGNFFNPAVQYPTQFYFGSFSFQYRIIWLLQRLLTKTTCRYEKEYQWQAIAPCAFRAAFCVHLILSVTHAQTITGTVSDEKGTKIPGFL